MSAVIFCSPNSSRPIKMAPPTRRRTKQREAEELNGNDSLERRFQGDFFQFSSVSWYALVLSGITLFAMLVFHPDLIPYHHLGPIGNFLANLKDNYRKSLMTGFRIMVLIHAIEAFATYRLCRRMKFTMKTTLMWTVQSLLLGFASYGIILKYSAERQHHIDNKKQ